MSDDFTGHPGDNHAICDNCGYSRGLHHYQTLQCPAGGEVPVWKTQEWMDSVFSLSGLLAERDQLRVALQSLLGALPAYPNLATGKWFIGQRGDTEITPELYEAIKKSEDALRGKDKPNETSRS